MIILSEKHGIENHGTRENSIVIIFKTKRGSKKKLTVDGIRGIIFLVIFVVIPLMVIFLVIIRILFPFVMLASYK